MPVRRIVSVLRVRIRCVDGRRRTGDGVKGRKVRRVRTCAREKGQNEHIRGTEEKERTSLPALEPQWKPRDADQHLVDLVPPPRPRGLGLQRKRGKEGGSNLGSRSDWERARRGDGRRQRDAGGGVVPWRVGLRGGGGRG